jgi:DNA-binding LytR/AlgR family response regulator
MITAIAIDDEPVALKIIENFCSKTPEIDLQKTFTDPREALIFLKKYPVDLVIVDVQMPKMTGIEFCKKLEQDCFIIFATANRLNAVEGFELNAIDYLVKPFSLDRFQQSINKVIERQKLKISSPASDKISFFIRADNKLNKVNFADIQYIEGLNDYIKVYLDNQPRLIPRMTIKVMESKLPASKFIRVHRSFIVPINRITSAKGKNIMIGDVQIPIGKSYQDAVRKMLEQNK